MTKYIVYRKHSEDRKAEETDFATKAEAKKYIAEAIAELEKVRIPHKVKKLAEVTNIRFTTDTGNDFSVGFWIEKI